MENNYKWHGNAPKDAEYELAMNELNAWEVSLNG